MWSREVGERRASTLEESNREAVGGGGVSKTYRY